MSQYTTMARWAKSKKEAIMARFPILATAVVVILALAIPGEANAGDINCSNPDPEFTRGCTTIQGNITFKAMMSASADDASTKMRAVYKACNNFSSDPTSAVVKGCKHAAKMGKKMVLAGVKPPKPDRPVVNGGGGGDTTYYECHLKQEWTSDQALAESEECKPCPDSSEAKTIRNPFGRRPRNLPVCEAGGIGEGCFVKVIDGNRELNGKCEGVCPEDKPAVDMEALACATCFEVDSEKPFWNAEAKACEPCPEGTTWNETSSKCEECPFPGQVLVATGEKDENDVPVKACRCPEGLALTGNEGDEVRECAEYWVCPGIGTPDAPVIVFNKDELAACGSILLDGVIHQPDEDLTEAGKAFVQKNERPDPEPYDHTWLVILMIILALCGGGICGGLIILYLRKKGGLGAAPVGAVEEKVLSRHSWRNLAALMGVLADNAAAEASKLREDLGRCPAGSSEAQLYEMRIRVTEENKERFDALILHATDEANRLEPTQ